MKMKETTSSGKRREKMNNYRVVNSRGKEIQTDVVLHPGEVLSDELEARSITKTAFADLLGMKLSHFSELVHGKRHVSAAIAIRLERLLDIPAEYWMRVQVYHDLFVERQKQNNAA
jgi:antitoxin HigA-1